MPQSSSQQRSGGPLRSSAASRGGTAVVSQAPFSSDYGTPPPPSRRLRSRSGQIEPALISSLPSFAIGVDVASRLPHSRSKTATQRCTGVSVSRTRAAATVAPQTSRLPSTRAARHRREPIWEEQSDIQAEDVTVLWQLPERIGTCRATSTRPPAIIPAPPVALKFSMQPSSVNVRSAAAGLTVPQAVQRQLEKYGDVAMQAQVSCLPSEASPCSVASSRPFSAPEEVASLTYPARAADDTLLNYWTSASASGPSLRMPTADRTPLHSVSPKGTANDVVFPQPAQPAVSLTESHHTTSPGPGDAGGSVEHSSVSHQRNHSTAPQPTPDTEASAWCFSVSSVSVRMPSSLPETSIPGNLIGSTLVSTAAAPPTESRLVFSSTGSSRDFCVGSPRAHSTSLDDALVPVHSLLLPSDDLAHPCQTSAASVSEPLEGDKGAPALPSTQNGAPSLSHSPFTSNRSSIVAAAPVYAVPEVATAAHASEQCRPRGALSSSASALKAAIRSQRGSPTFSGVYGASSRQPHVMDYPMGSGGGRTVSSSRGVRTPASHSPHPTRSPRTNSSSTPRRLGKSLDCHRSATPAMASPRLVNSAVTPGTKSPAWTLSAELARQATKDRRRRELYAWNEQLRLQNESDIQDAV